MNDLSQPLVCVNHPQIETSLRCNRCERPICSKCAVLTPTGYRCKDCINNQQKTFDTAIGRDYVVGFALAGFLGFIGSLIVLFLPIGILTVLLAPAIGAGIGEAVRRTTQKRRSRRLFLGAAIAIGVGALPALAILLASIGFLALGGGIRGLASGLLPLLWQGIYIFLAASSAYYRLAGISLRR